MTRGQRLRKLRDFRKISQEKLAELVGVSQGTITKIETNGAENSVHIYKICKVLDCSMDWLESGLGLSPFDQNNKLHENHIPIVDPKYVKKNPDFDTMIKNRTGTLIMSNGHPRFFALQVYDNSMINPLSEKSLFIGDKIIIDPDKEPEHNDLIVIKYLNDGKNFFIKQYIKEGTQIRLVSFDSNRYPPLDLTDSIEICGVIVERRTIF